jgi:hypothetical protein
LWARAYGLIPVTGASPHSVPLLGPGPGFDRDYAMTTDLAMPVIIATVPVPGDCPPAPLLIDGYALPVTVHNWGHCAWCLIAGDRKSLLAEERRPCVTATEPVLFWGERPSRGAMQAPRRPAC